MTRELINPEVECLKLKKSINENHRLIQTATGEVVDRAVLTGELFLKWKELLPHGRFESFVEDHFDGSLRTAQIYMQVSKRLNALPKSAKSALLKQERSIAGLIPAKPNAPRKGAAPAGGTDDQGTTPQPVGSVDYGKCPNCAGSKWTEDEDGVSCAKCHHPHGEPTGGADDDRVGTQRSKTVKTAEALMRAFDDLHLLVSKADEHAESIASCKFLVKTAKAWK